MGTFFLVNITSLGLSTMLNQLHAVSRIQGRRREFGVKTLRSPPSTEFWRDCGLAELNDALCLSMYHVKKIPCWSTNGVS